jgi:transcriptional regulator with XRE-family HTH domain
MDKKIDYKKLRDTRVDKDLTQKEMAAKLSVEQSAYNKMESGKNGIRAEQLVIIAEALGKTPNDLLKKDKMGNVKIDSVQSENEFLKSMLKLYRSHIQSELCELSYKYENKFPYYEYTFEQFLEQENDWQGPNDAVERIKEDVKEWIKDESCSYFYFEWDKENGIRNFIDKDDIWLNEFVRKEENYDLVFWIVGCPTYQTQEDYYKAFKNMLEENRFIHEFFQYGLMEDHPYWQKYLEENKSTFTGDGMQPYNELIESQLVANKEKTLISRKNREEIRSKMRQVLSHEA